MYTIAFLSPMVDGPMDAWEVSCCTSRISRFPKVPQVCLPLHASVFVVIRDRCRRRRRGFLILGDRVPVEVCWGCRRLLQRVLHEL